MHTETMNNWKFHNDNYLRIMTLKTLWCLIDLVARYNDLLDKNRRLEIQLEDLKKMNREEVEALKADIEVLKKGGVIYDDPNM